VSLGEGGRLLPDVRELLAARLEPAFAELKGFERGLRAGGALRRFFVEELPEAELSSPSIERALSRARADLGAELRPALLSAIADVIESLCAKARQGAIEAERAVERAERERIEPMRALSAVVESVVEESMAHSQAVLSPL